MKKMFTSLALAAAILSASLYSPKAEALVGYIFKNKIVKTVGGIGAIGGAGVGVYGAVTAGTASGWSALGGVILAAYGGIIAGVGLIILDDDSLGDIEFRAVDPNDPEQYLGFSRQEALVYNSEVELLNSIRQTIISEVDDTADTEDAEELWELYAPNLSPATYEIAKAKAKEFIENFKN